MVKITNKFGDVKTGKQHTVVYQGHYGNQMRRMLIENKDERTRGQLEQRDRFRTGIDFAKNLTKAQRDFIKSYMAEAGIKSPDGLPTTWYTFAKKIAMTRPEVEMETGAGDGFSGTYANWSYRKPITLNNQSGGTLPIYRVLITLTTENFNYSKCKNDGSDIRFSKIDGVTPLPYWIEDWNYNGTSKIWIKVDNILTGVNNYSFLYYGNSGASDECNGDNTFTFFDGFPGTSLDPSKWNGDTSYATVSGGILDYYHPTSGSWKTLKTISGYPLPHAIKIKVKWSNESCEFNKGANFGGVGVTEVDHAKYEQFSNAGLCHNLQTINNSNVTRVSNNFLTTTYAIFEILIGTSNVKFYKDGVLLNTLDTNIPTDDLKGLIQSTGRHLYVDYWFIREYTPSEPSVILQDEETGSANTILTGFKIHHPAIKSYEIKNNGPKEENISNLTDHISTVITRKNLNITADEIVVTTLADQEYIFTIK